METPTKAELRVLRGLWKLKKGFLKDIVAILPEPKPAYTTVSTLLGRMEKKQLVGYERMGRDKYYYPLLKKSNYLKQQFQRMIGSFFNDSTAQFASFFTENSDLSLEELKELRKILEQQIEKKQQDVE